ncbi:MAG: four helix bundle protein [Bacteroidetes bacterium]|nr:four helix bundle protein [Bacteroidota bacterium]
MSEKVRTFEDLILWQKAHQLALFIYSITKNFPNEEKFGLVSQMRRAAISIPSNIVEGHSRKSKKEFINFLSIAKGSLNELRYQILLSKDLKYIDMKEFETVEQYFEEISKILYSFTRSLNKSIS